MSNRGLAPVIDINQARQRRARGAKVLRGQARRVNPETRGARLIVVPDVEKIAAMDRSEIRAIDRGTMRPPMRAKKVRRARRQGDRVASPRPLVLSRAARRAAWKVERRVAWKVERRVTGWTESKSFRGELAPVVPFRHRGMLARIARKGHSRRRAIGQEAA